MHILFMSWWWPYPPHNGSKIRIYNLLRQLAKKHEVSLLSFVEPGEATDEALAHLRTFCANVETVPKRHFHAGSLTATIGYFSRWPRSLIDSYSLEMAGRASAYSMTRGVDLIIGSQLPMVRYLQLAPGIPTILEELEVTGYYEQIENTAGVARRLRRSLTLAKTQKLVQHLLASGVVITVVSEDEARYIRKLAPNADRVFVVPNGVDTEAHVPGDEAPQPYTLIYPGAVTYSANYDAVAYFIRQVLPRIRERVPHTRFTVTGDTGDVNVDDLKNQPGVHFSGFLPSVAAAVRESWATVVPLREGGGTRLKVLESMALGTPVISTAKGAEGLRVRHGENILIANSPEEITNAVCNLFEDAALRQKLATAGRALAEKDYNWSAIGRQLLHLIDETVQGHKMVSKAQSVPTTPTEYHKAGVALFTAREWVYVSLVIVAVLVITALPYVFAYRSAPPDKQFMGVMVNIPDHFQYFSWMRESQTQVLVPNQLTPEDSTPLLFNFLWWTLGRIEALTGISYDGLYQITRWLAGAFVMAATYFFCGVVFTSRAKRWTAFLVATLGAGLGWLLVVEKTLRRLPDVNSPFALYTSEPNTFLNVLAFPHFSIAAGLIAVIFGLVLLGQRSQNLRYAWVAAAVSLLLGVQHAYDMFIIYPVIGLYALFIWLRDRKFPMYLFKLGVIVVLVSVWPALHAYYITTADEVWKAVLAQFDNAGAFTPGPLLLPILMGVSWLLAIWALDIRTPWRERDDTHLFILAWFLAHFPLVYIPLDFQIHLLSGWQIITAVLATIGIYTRVVPFLQRFFRNTSRQRLALYASVALVLLVIPTNLYLLAWRFVDLRRADYPFFVPKANLAALEELEARGSSDDVVLSTVDMGIYVPALTGVRSFLGHWAQTLDYFGKQEMVAAFFDAETDDAERQRILSEYSVDYVLYTERERLLGDYDPASAAFLEEVYNEDGAALYAVRLDEVALAR